MDQAVYKIIITTHKPLLVKYIRSFLVKLLELSLHRHVGPPFSHFSQNYRQGASDRICGPLVDTSENRAQIDRFAGKHRDKSVRKYDSRMIRQQDDTVVG